MNFWGAVKQHRGLAVAAFLGRLALLHQGTVVNPRPLPCPLQRQIGMVLPGGAPFPQQLAAVPLPRLDLVQACSGGFS